MPRSHADRRGAAPGRERRASRHDVTPESLAAKREQQLQAKRERYRTIKNLPNRYARLKPDIYQEWFVKLFHRQRGQCALCGVGLVNRYAPGDDDDPSSKTPVLDHCHGTGRIRGLLCAGCNTALGRYEKWDIDVLGAYLDRAAL